MSDKIEWIAVDWGTTNLRCFAISPEGQVINTAESDQGMAAVNEKGGDFEGTLLSIIDHWLDPGRNPPVIACGMVGAKQGWQEVPYDEAPCSPRTSLTKVNTESGVIDVWIHAGVKQSEPADVMRGEETQISGFLAMEPEFAGMICLPGTHSKWAKIVDGAIHTFSSSMTGEVFDLLSKHSILRHSVGSDEWNDDSFAEGVRESFEHPAKVLNRLFSIRARDLLQQSDKSGAKAYLSGSLIGLEMAGVLENLSIEEVIIIGSPGVSERYQTALASLNIPTRCFSSGDITLKGLESGYRIINC
ncbi:MAG: 2-dehydro-3-deoxygalactonokinase [Verrucomicrobiales bacterium]|nr:2-dehydro-3-deoxygalactonokinase [Verrucomicrobiales bacterium]